MSLTPWVFRWTSVTAVLGTAAIGIQLSLLPLFFAELKDLRSTFDNEMRESLSLLESSYALLSPNRLKRRTFRVEKRATNAKSNFDEYEDISIDEPTSSEPLLLPACPIEQNKCPAGPPGPRGTRGLPGKAGLDGYNGLEGHRASDIPVNEQQIFCTVCPMGREGRTGPIGKRGSAGLPGADGVTGMSGRNGQPGSPGEQGVPGVPGINGKRGERGQIGMNVKIMPKRGRKGPPGIAGPPGPAGQTGNHNLIRGKAGVQGRNGRRGNSGKPGILGEAGEIGTRGADGTRYCNCNELMGMSIKAAQNFAYEQISKSIVNDYENT
ncbi:unnamed protein product [Caenorhabditis auriculariae]|uniref:Nematode cuticle collagen N-terminal domain-containing protein n=1 Tax=Caenorhabditis auriculariae TaxID=2777116 RepID=A0A8S1H8F1_9PELO|nr:unnamed protein product [Caenorhabditis auriculariae]